MSRGKQNWLTIFFIVLQLSKPSVQFKGWSVLAEKCEEMLVKVEACWIENSDIPTCNGDDPALKCAEEAKDNIKNCNSEIKDGVLQRFNAIQVLKDAMCENTELKDEFEKKISCWHTARSCTSRLAMMFDDSNGDSDEKDKDSSEEEDECSKLLDDVESCNEISAGCTDMQSNLTYKIFEKSPCVAHAEKFMAENGARYSTCDFFTVVAMTLLFTSLNW